MRTSIRFLRSFPGFLLTLALVPAVASAGNPDEVTDVERGDGPAIFQGQPADHCAWPNTVAVQNGGSLCTGTLITPEVVLYAAHCGASNTQIRFGESTGGGAKTVTPEFCQTNPGYGGVNDQGHDWAYCKLSQPITDLPVTPILFGCEGELLQNGGSVYIVGFGQTHIGGAGTKYWAETSFIDINVAGGTVSLGGNGQPSVCPGDSGGPAFIRHPQQGTWHHVGIASTVAGGCGGFGTHALSAAAVNWVEEGTGTDVTPCFDPNGTWNPGPFCGDFYMGEPGVGYGTFSGEWCEGTPRLPFSATCGDGFGGDDDVPPTVSISSPADGTAYDGTSAEVTITIDAADDSGFIKEVGIIIDGDEQPAYDTMAPYEFGGVVFPEGQYVLEAVARDFAGNETISDPIGIGIGVDPPDPTTGDEGADEGISDGTGSGPGGRDDDGGEGCSCSTTPSQGAAPLGLMMLAGLGLAGVRRRRRATNA